MSQGNPSDKEVEDYCQAWMGNGNDQTKAWRIAFPRSKAAPESQHVSASEMHKNTKVQLRILELANISAEIADEVYGITADSLIKDLADIRKRALEDGQYGPAVSSVMGQSKICGFDVQKIEMEVSGALDISSRVAQAKARAREAMNNG